MNCNVAIYGKKYYNIIKISGPIMLIGPLALCENMRLSKQANFN